MILADGSTLDLTLNGETIVLSVKSELAPTSAPVALTLTEAEQLVKDLAPLMAKVRGKRAKA
jgi:hypothetical protein